MLQINRICKQYTTGHLVQKALDGVSLAFRDSEFVAILGPSGSGKTTLLNMIGGLDRYDSGDLIINGISTKKYKDRDWDAYRNHSIGFVFQSYNLIPHQSILANVELALTISGESKKVRRKRAKAALEQVGLEDQLHKKPSQLSGGQMQRVAIARALVNNPDILLADEPTGALDSETSVQVMELLKDVAKHRLVIMVTHNPELANAYASRIVNLRDGKIQSDSNPFTPPPEQPAAKPMGKASMSFLTALSLSFHNLKTKKARTLLTSFAGSIGIIGIALILAISNGVNAYIQSIEKDTLSEYPLKIQSAGFNLASLMMGGTDDAGETGEVTVTQMVASLFSTVEENDLASLKAYLDSQDSGITTYATAVEYSYDVTPQIYRLDGSDVRQVHPDHSLSSLGLGSEQSANSLMSSAISTDVFYEMPAHTELFQNQYTVKAGHWPENANECVVVLTAGGSISDFLLYTLGLRDSQELDDMVAQFAAGESVDTPTGIRAYAYEDLLGITFKVVHPGDCYVYDSALQTWTDQSEQHLASLVANGEDLTIVGIVQPVEGTVVSALSPGIAYPAALTQHIIETAASSEIVQAQLNNPTINVFTGEAFGEERGEFPLDTLFSVDEAALQSAFQVDGSALSVDLGEMIRLDGVDLSGMLDLGEIAGPELSGLDFSSILTQVDLTISPEALGDLVCGLADGFAAYAESHPEADYSRLGEHFLAYLQSPEVQDILCAGLEEILAAAGPIRISAQALETLVLDIAAGFPEFAAANGYTDPERFSEYFALYLQTPQAQEKLEASIQKLGEIQGELTISAQQLQALTQEILQGYRAYAAANTLPDPANLGQVFLAYFQTPEAQEQFMTGLAQLIDLEGLQAQLTAAIERQLGAAMETYGSAISQAIGRQISAAMTQAAGQISRQVESAMTQAMAQMGSNLEGAFTIDQEVLSNAITFNLSTDELAALLLSFTSAADSGYETNLTALGYADLDSPSAISIYPKDFESKTGILDILDEYNRRMEAEGMPERCVRYTDMVGTLMSSITEIVNIISYVLVAFVAISLIVSSIMIGVITYISVLERKKEIGILRAIGASKGNVAQVFNAETFIVGLCAGLLGIAITLLLLLPINALIHHLSGQANLNAILAPGNAAVLVLLSVLLTMLGGLIPARKAAKNDPVAALRTE